jgi:protease-4
MTRISSRIVVTILLAIAFAMAFPLAPRAEVLPPEIGSVAVNDDGTALLTNPAAMCASVRSAFYLSWDHSNDNSDRIGSGILSTSGFGIGYQRRTLPGAERVTHFLIGGGGGRNARLSFGVRGDRESERRNPNLKDATWRWDLGALARPASFVSIGAVGHDVTQSKLLGGVLQRSYTAGIALRPIPGVAQTRLTLFADASGPENLPWRRYGSFHGGAWAEVAPGVQVGAAVDGPLGSFSKGRAFSFGVSLSGVEGSLIGGLFLDRQDKSARSVQAIQGVGSRQKTLVHPPVLARTGIDGIYGDESQGGLPLPIIGAAGSASIRPILRDLDNARRDPAVRGVLLDLGSVSAGALGDEIRERITRLRESGKPVVAFSREISSRGEYFIASACDRIVLDEAGDVSSLGMRIDLPYYGEMLDSLGIRFEKVAHGKYKTAYEDLAQGHASEGQIESLNSVLDDVNGHFLDSVSRDRKIPREKLEELCDGRILVAEDALAAGLVDSLGDQRAARRILARMAGMKGEPGTVSTRDWDWRDDRWSRPARVVVLWLDGAIVDGRSERGFLGGNTMGSETVVAQLRAISRRHDVKAVVLRIDSPGGSGLASDEIWRAVEEVKKSGKKVVSSMSRVAGSGGYYIACNSDKIVADPMTITGSIGVLWLKSDVRGFYDRKRIHVETFERGKFMGINSSSTGLTSDERAMVQADIDRFYARFIDRVHSGRGMTPQAVDSVAQGRIWTGAQALSRGLIDRVGGLDEAVRLASELAGLPEDVRVENIHRPRGWWIAREIGNAATRIGIGRDPGWETGAHLDASIVAASAVGLTRDPLAAWLAGESLRRASGSSVSFENPLLPILAAEP